MSRQDSLSKRSKFNLEIVNLELTKNELETLDSTEQERTKTHLINNFDKKITNLS